MTLVDPDNSPLRGSMGSSSTKDYKTNFVKIDRRRRRFEKETTYGISDYKWDLP